MTGQLVCSSNFENQHLDLGLERSDKEMITAEQNKQTNKVGEESQANQLSLDQINSLPKPHQGSQQAKGKGGDFPFVGTVLLIPNKCIRN